MDRPAPDTVEFTYYTGKVSLQANPAHRFIGFYTQSHKPEEGESGDEVAYESRKQQDNYQLFGKGEWQGVRGNSLIANLQLGHYPPRSGRLPRHDQRPAI